MFLNILLRSVSVMPNEVVTVAVFLKQYSLCIYSR